MIQKKIKRNVNYQINRLHQVTFVSAMSSTLTVHIGADSFQTAEKILRKVWNVREVKKIELIGSVYAQT